MVSNTRYLTFLFVYGCVCVSLGTLLVGICIGLAWLEGGGLGGILFGLYVFVCYNIMWRL